MRVLIAESQPFEAAGCVVNQDCPRPIVMTYRQWPWSGMPHPAVLKECRTLRCADAPIYLHAGPV
jgi:hypothetical protein